MLEDEKLVGGDIGEDRSGFGLVWFLTRELKTNFLSTPLPRADHALSQPLSFDKFACINNAICMPFFEYEFNNDNSQVVTNYYFVIVLPTFYLLSLFFSFFYTSYGPPTPSVLFRRVFSSFDLQRFRFHVEENNIVRTPWDFGIWF